MVSPAPVIQTTTLAAAAATLGRARHRAELVDALASALYEHTQAQAIQVVWLDARTPRNLLDTAGLPEPHPPERVRMELNQIVQRHQITFVPLVVAGTLRGWITLDCAQHLEAAQLLASQAAPLLVCLDPSALITAQLMHEQQQTVDRLIALSAFSLAATDAGLSPTELISITVGGAMGTTQGVVGGANIEPAYGVPPLQQGRLAPVWSEAINQLLAQHALETGGIEVPQAALPAGLREMGINSLICVALRGTNMLLGQLWVAYGTPVVVPADREMVLLYAKTAGAVLENMYLFSQLRQAHDRLASIMTSSNEGLLMLDQTGTILVANETLSWLLGAPDQHLDNGDVRTLIQLIGHHNGDPGLLESALFQVTRDKHTAYAGDLHLATPTPRDLTWSVVPVQASDTTTQAALLIVRDVTAEYQASKLRQDLAHMVVHDLRAPLANIIASLDLLLKQRVGILTARQERITQIASDSSHHMAELVDALLDMRRLEHWQFDLQRRSQALFSLVQETCNQFEQRAQGRGIMLHNETAHLPALAIDAELVRRLLQNLIDNAIKFSYDDGLVHITATVVDEADLPPEHLAGRWARIRVRDHGPGVPAAYHTHIFELFGQAPHGRSRGSGIGLAFCKLAVESHGGSIWVDQAPGGGALFSFTLPLA